MSPWLLNSNVVVEGLNHEERTEMNDWKLGSIQRGTLSGWGYRESRFLPKPRGPIRRALAATANAVFTLLPSR